MDTLISAASAIASEPRNKFQMTCPTVPNPRALPKANRPAFLQSLNAVPKATNPKAIAEAERKAKIKLAKDQAVGKALSDAKQDVQQAIANTTAKGDYATLELLIAKAKADGKANDKKANEALAPQKEAIIKSIRSCNNKATLDKIAKLLG